MAHKEKGMIKVEKNLMRNWKENWKKLLKFI